MTKVVETEKYTVRIHGNVNKEKLLNVCKRYAQKVNLGGTRDEKIKNCKQEKIYNNSNNITNSNN